MTTEHIDTTEPAAPGEIVHMDGTPPMSAPTYRACACGWSTSGSSHSSAVDKLQKHLAPYTPAPIET